MEKELETYEPSKPFQTFVLTYVCCIFLLMLVLFLVAKLSSSQDKQGETRIPVVVKPFITLFLKHENGSYKSRYAEYYTVNSNFKGPYFDGIKKLFDQKLSQVKTERITYGQLFRELPEFVSVVVYD